VNIVIVGCGVSSYSFLLGLGKLNNVKITLICPKTLLKTELVKLKNISAKFFDKDNHYSLSSYLSTFNQKLTNFKHIGVHKEGGMAKIWGASVGVFSENDLIKNQFNIDDYYKNLQELQKKIVISGNSKDSLKTYFPYLDISDSIEVSDRIKSLYGEYLDGDLKIGTPRLFVNRECNSCNRCLEGCKDNYIFYPSFNNLDLNITIIDDIVTKIDNRYVYLKNDKIEYNKLILGANVFSNFKLLSTFSKQKESYILTTPAVAFAWIYPYKNQKEFFGMGNATFYYKEKFYGNLYDGYSLTISNNKVFSKNLLIDKLKKQVSKHMVVGLGFLSSDYATSTIKLENDLLKIEGKFNPNYHLIIKQLKTDLKKFIKNRGNFLFYQPLEIGTDIHYGGGIPNDLTIDELEKNNIFVLGGSLFRYLPPVSPSFSFMIKSYEIGKKIKGSL